MDLHKKLLSNHSLEHFCTRNLQHGFHLRPILELETRFITTTFKRIPMRALGSETKIGKLQDHIDFPKDKRENISLVQTSPEKKNPTTTSPSVAILLCTHEGEQFIEEQLDSILSQDHQNFTIWASDDGAEDRTGDILRTYQEKFGEEILSISSGPRKGYTANFLSLVCNKNIEADYFAFSDQDDIWEQNKLTRAIHELEKVPSNTPALYCSRTLLIDEDGKKIGYSPLFTRPPSFANALVQNIGGGNTMVMNKAARNTLMTAGEFPVVSHDWWAYLLITAVGGTVIYNPNPTIQYRQHSSNLVGSNTSWRDRSFRLKMLLKGRFRKWSSLNIQALKQVEHLLTANNNQILSDFCNARNQRLLPRLKGNWKSGIYRQTILGNIRMILEIILKKL